MEIKYFKLIKTIVEEGSIANSTNKLFLTQSALSHQLKDLEERLGFKVFIRTRNKWELTEEGTELYTLGNEVLERIEKGFQSIEKLRSGSIGTIKISTECYSFYHGLSSFIQRMGILYPEINVNLVLEATHQPISKVLENDIDIAISTIQPKHKNLSSIEIYEDEIFAIMHQENTLSTKNYIEASDFENNHLIIHSFPLETVSVYELFLKPNKIMPPKISAIPLTEIALEMVSANMGILCLPKWAIKSFKISNELIFKRISNKGLKRTHYLVFRKKDAVKKYIHDFIFNFKTDFSRE